jgi:predicted TIM-barrel fold metal-dependent hydrolase
MVIVDAQVHIWGTNTPECPWPPDGMANAHRAVPLGKDALLREMDAARPALEPVLAASRHPNIAVKASALPCYITEPYPIRNLHPHIRRVLDAYGPRRVFWGTDLTRLPCSHRQVVTLFTEEVNFLSSEDKEWIMGRGIAEWLGWPLPRN